MRDFTDFLRNAEYVGRFLIVGKSNNGFITAIYGITGRSPSSQARRLELSDDQRSIIVQPTDPEIVKKGNPDLLIYPAIALSSEHVIVSNGKQTESIMDAVQKRTYSVVGRLNQGTENYSYEPDEPNYTPRISACIDPLEGVAIGILKRGSVSENTNFTIRNTEYYAFQPATGWGIATYTGENKNPLPPFEGNPIQMSLDFWSLEEAVETIYDLLAPNNGKDDFRVSVAGVIYDGHLNNFFDTYIKNRF